MSFCLPGLPDKTQMAIFTKVGASLPCQGAVAELMQADLEKKRKKKSDDIDSLPSAS